MDDRAIAVFTVNKLSHPKSFEASFNDICEVHRELFWKQELPNRQVMKIVLAVVCSAALHSGVRCIFFPRRFAIRGAGGFFICPCGH